MMARAAAFVNMGEGVNLFLFEGNIYIFFYIATLQLIRFNAFCIRYYAVERLRVLELNKVSQCLINGQNFQ